MLKFEKLSKILQNIISEKVGEETNKRNIIETLLIEYKEIKKDELNLINKEQFNFPFAIPCEEPTKTYRNSAFRGEYSILAVDGSDTPMQDDFWFPYFVINIGYAFAQYGKNHQFIADSFPKIYYRSNEIFEDNSERKTPLNSEAINAKMLLEESVALAKLIHEIKSSVPQVSLIDGSLIQWGAKTKSEIHKKKYIGEYEKVFGIAEMERIPVAGYISGSRSKDILGTIKVHLLLKGKKTFDEEASFIYDVDLFSHLLKPGERSILFINYESLLTYYSNPVFFYYLNNSSEIVRIEVPSYVAKSENHMKTLNEIILNQTQKGLGYPPILKEAHEQAVIHNKEKDALENILLIMLFEKDKNFKENQKNFSKKIRSF